MSRNRMTSHKVRTKGSSSAAWVICTTSTRHSFQLVRPFVRDTSIKQCHSMLWGATDRRQAERAAGSAGGTLAPGAAIVGVVTQVVADVRYRCNYLLLLLLAVSAQKVLQLGAHFSVTHQHFALVDKAGMKMSHAVLCCVATTTTNG